jgi:hypothetical protein
MRFMNTYDIDEVVRRYSADTVLGRAARFLAAYRDEVDSHSDGWAYWSAPVKAAKKLIELFDNPVAATESDFRKALGPIRSFYTKRGKAAGMEFPALD